MPKAKRVVPEEISVELIHDPEIIRRSKDLIIAALDEAEKMLKFGDVDQRSQMVRFIVPTMNKMIDIEKKNPKSTEEDEQLAARQREMMDSLRNAP